MTALETIKTRSMDTLDWAPMTDVADFRRVALMTDLSALRPPHAPEFGVGPDGQAVQWPAGLLLPGSLDFATAAIGEEADALHAAAVDREAIRYRLTFLGLEVMVVGRGILKYAGSGGGEHAIADQRYHLAVLTCDYYHLDGRPIR